MRVSEIWSSRQLALLYEGDQGVCCCQERAESVLGGPNCNKYIDDLVAQCADCVLRLAPNVPNTNGNSGKNIWQHVGIDLLHLERHDYVLIIYYYCRFRGVVTLGTILAEVVDAMFKSSFARFGTAYSMQTDNRAQFAFKEFADLELAYGFHEISNPRYHHAMR
ncbi:hypothetical protein MRX96_027964 [Rhipicephalus microplus]